MISEDKVAKLVEESQQDNKESLDKLFNAFRPFRHGLASSYANKGVEYDDICQQVDMFFIMSVLDYNKELSDSPILHIASKTRRLTSNYYKDELRYQKRLKFYGLAVDIEDGLCGDSNIDISSIALDSELENFTQLEKDVFNLYVRCDLTQAEVADILGYSREGVRDILGRIKEKLKNRM